MSTSVPRLRRIRYKDGRTVEVLRPKAFDPVALAEAVKNTVLDHAAAATGPYSAAIVVWGSDCTTTGRVWNTSQIPGILVPDLVRNVLIGLKIEGWTLETLKGK